MCGFCGYSGASIEARLQKMNDRMIHRGPDGAGYYQDPEGMMNLGHRRLAIIDLHTGTQPMCNEQGNLWLVFNGEIYNYQELRNDLIASGRHMLATTSDSEVLLHLYEDLGHEMLCRLNGMFAFALWDEKNHRLFLARDRLGVKPLYWTWHQGRLIFASELKAILCWPEIPKRMNPTAFSLYLSLRYIPDPDTIYQGIQRLLPGHYLTWTPGEEPKMVRYWDLDFTPHKTEFLPATWCECRC
ncbi:MAG: hypothetical protein H7839_17775, partial [Magnetococcus sp. YQC-5]